MTSTESPQLEKIEHRIRRRRARRRRAGIASVALVVVAAAVAGYAVLHSSNSGPTKSTTTTSTPSTGFSQARQGIWSDRWMQQHARMPVAGGQAGVLVLGLLDTVPNQRLQVIANGLMVADTAVARGVQTMSIPVGPARRREIELRWAAAARIGPEDARVAAARLQAIRIAHPHAPAGIASADFAKSSTAASGIFADGWMQRDARVLLGGGPAAVLGLDALVTSPGQSLRLLVNGQPVFDGAVAAGDSPLSLPIGPSSSARLIELRWSKDARIGPNDPRDAAALLRTIRIATAAAPRLLDRSRIAASNAAATGIYRDGWMREQVSTLLRGGSAGTLTLTVEVVKAGQSVQAFVDGKSLGARALPPGRVRVMFSLPSHRGPRLIALKFAFSVPISAADRRVAAALLEGLAVRAPTPSTGTGAVTTTAALP